jgi:hypothetical protein
MGIASPKPGQKYGLFCYRQNIISPNYRAKHNNQALAEFIEMREMKNCVWKTDYYRTFSDVTAIRGNGNHIGYLRMRQLPKQIMRIALFLASRNFFSFYVFFI